jgi:hypothetical protein
MDMENALIIIATVKMGFMVCFALKRVVLITAVKEEAVLRESVYAKRDLLEKIVAN